MIEDGFVSPGGDAGKDNDFWADATDDEDDLTEIKEDDWPTDARLGLLKLINALDSDFGVAEIPPAARQWLETDVSVQAHTQLELDLLLIKFSFHTTTLVLLCAARQA